MFHIRVLCVRVFHLRWHSYVGWHIDKYAKQSLVHFERTWRKVVIIYLLALSFVESILLFTKLIVDTTQECDGNLGWNTIICPLHNTAMTKRAFLKRLCLIRFEGQETLTVLIEITL